MATVAPRPEVFSWNLPYDSWDQEGQIALLTDAGGDSMAAFWRVGSLSVELKSADALGALADHISNLFRCAPQESTLQLILTCRPTRGRAIERWLSGSSADAPLLHKRAEERAHFLRSFWLDRNPALFFARDIDLYMTFRSATLPIPWSLTDPSVREQNQYRRAREEFLSAAEAIESAARTVGIPAERLSFEETFDLIWRMLNPRAALEELPPKPHLTSSIAEQLLSAPLQRHWDTGTLVVDQIHMRVLTAHAPPVVTTTGQFSRELSAGVNQLALVDLIPFGWLSLSFVKPDQEHYAVKLGAKKRAAMAQTLFGSASARAVLEDIEGMSDTLAHNRHALHTFVHVVLGAPDPEVLQARVRTLRSAMSSINFQVQAEDAYADLGFRCSLPAGVAATDGPRDGMGRAITLTDLGAAHVAPLYFGPHSTKNADHIFLDRRGRVLTTSLFDNPTQVGHTVIIGPVGSGKSVFLKDKILDVLRKGGYVIVLNRHTMGGRETNDYYRFTQLLGEIGQFVDFDVRRPPDIDICAGPYDQETNLFLTHLIAEIATLGRPDAQLATDEVNSLSRSIGDAYKYNARHHDGRMRFSDIRDMLEGDTDPTVRRLGKSLQMFTDDGPYAGFFDGQTDNLIRKGARFICYELCGIAKYKEIRTPLILALFYKAGRFFETLDPNVPKLFISEEAAALFLDTPRTADLLEKQERLYRKVRGACVLVTQHARDLDSPQGRSILADKTNLILLQHARDDVAETARFLDLDADQARALASLTSEPGRYAEFMWLSPTVQGVLTMLLGPHNYWWITSHPADTAALTAERAVLSTALGRDPTYDELIDHMAQKYPWGRENAP